MPHFSPALLAALLLGATAASAQTTFSLGVRGGLSRAITTVDPAGTGTYGGFVSFTTSKEALYAGQGGLVGEARWGQLALQTGLLFSQKGERVNVLTTTDGITRTTSSQENINRYNWLELPVSFVYTPGGDHGLQLLAGPYLALAVGGHRQITYYPAYPASGSAPATTTDVAFAYGADSNNRRLDAGLNFGLGYRRGPVQVQLSYGLGLRNLHQAGTALNMSTGRDYQADAAYNRVAQLTASYFFQL